MLFMIKNHNDVRNKISIEFNLYYLEKKKHVYNQSYIIPFSEF